MSNKDMRHYMSLVEEAGSIILGYALKESDGLGRFVTWKSGQDSYSKTLRQMFATIDEAENAKNQRDSYLKKLLKITVAGQDDQQISVVKKLIDTPIVVVAISARTIS